MFLLVGARTILCVNVFISAPFGWLFLWPQVVFSPKHWRTKLDTQGKPAAALSCSCTCSFLSSAAWYYFDLPRPPISFSVKEDLWCDSLEPLQAVRWGQCWGSHHLSRIPTLQCPISNQMLHVFPALFQGVSGRSYLKLATSRSLSNVVLIISKTSVPIFQL